MHRGGEVLVIDRCCTVADDDIAIGSVALAMSAFGGNTDIPFQGRHDRF